MDESDEHSLIELNPPEENRSYSSIFKDSPNFQLSQLDSEVSWIAGENVPGEWMVMDIGKDGLTICGIVAQVRNSSRNAVTKFKVETRVKPRDRWNPVDKGAEFDTGIKRWDESHNHILFSKPVQCRYVKITVVAWSNQIALRAGLLTPNVEELNPPEERRSYSSVFKGSTAGTGFARSMLDSELAWCAQENEMGQWMDIDAGKVISVAGIVAQARSDVDQFPTVIKAEARSKPDDPWVTIDKNAPMGTQIDGRNEIRRHIVFSKPVMARFIRINVVRWNGHISLRAGLLVTKPTIPPAALRNYGHAYWNTSWRKYDDDRSQDILCFETGEYGLKLDMGDLTKVHFGQFNHRSTLSYTEVLDSNKRGRMDRLAEEDLLIQVQVGSTTYKVTTCNAATDRRNRNVALQTTRLRHTRLWEAGQIVQHYDLQGLVLRADDRSPLRCEGKLDIVVWPNAFAITLELSPPDNTTWNENTIVKMAFKNWRVQQKYAGGWVHTKKETTTLHCGVTGHISPINGIGIRFEGGKPISFDSLFGGYVGKIDDPKRNFDIGYTDIRNYDKFNVAIENNCEEDVYVPFLLHLNRPANATGCVVMVCDAAGKPLGIPIQLSKNWHCREMGEYVRAFTMLPSPPGSKLYTITIVYSFYGKLPSASHANLSLIGYHGDSANGRWEQLAIGSFGETFCMDVEFCYAKKNIITDIRGLMIRKGKTGPMWRWTNGGWGGDWLNAADGNHRKLYSNEMKVAYVSQGPCLTEVQYSGYYGQHRWVQLYNTVRTLRTDDFARTFVDLRYTFQRRLLFKDTYIPDGTCFFRMGGSSWEGLHVPSIAYGNRRGLIKEYKTPTGLKPNTLAASRILLSGPGPWWVAYNTMKFITSNNTSTKGEGWKAFIIRKYHVRTVNDGQRYSNPSISLYVRQVFDDGGANLDVLVTPPSGVNEFNTGDVANIDLEWMVLPFHVNDYYGPNREFRTHLLENSRSWKTVLNEVQKNNYKVDVIGAKVKNQYPLIFAAVRKDEIRFSISSGAGAVPVRFDGLTSVNYTLHQVVPATEDGAEEQLKCDPHENVHQTHYDASCCTYSIAFNLPMDGKEKTEWILKRE